MTAGQRWSKERPTVPGWYWFRWGAVSAYIVAKVWLDDCDWRVLMMGHEYDGALAGYTDGEWQGPITPHDQEAG